LVLSESARHEGHKHLMQLSSVLYQRS
jgi:hypothetical protein